MSERTDRIINDHLKQRPAAQRAYQNDPTLRHQVEWARRLLAVMELVMQREGIVADAEERVLNEVMHVALGDWEQEKLRRERDLLLIRFDAPEPGHLSSPVFTTPAGDSRFRDDVTPERMHAWLEKQIPERTIQQLRAELELARDGRDTASTSQPGEESSQ